MLLPALDGRNLSLARIEQRISSGRWVPNVAPEGVARARREYFHRLETFEIGGPGVRATEELLEHGAAGAVHCLVVMPEGPVFRSWYPPTTAAASHRYLTELAHRHGLPLIDARGWMDARSISSTRATSPVREPQLRRRLTRDVVLPALRGRPPESLAAVPAVPAGRP